MSCELMADAMTLCPPLHGKKQAPGNCQTSFWAHWFNGNWSRLAAVKVMKDVFNSLNLWWNGPKRLWLCKKILDLSHATSKARRQRGSLKVDWGTLKVRSFWYRAEDLKAASNLIHYVDDSLTLLIKLWVKPISPDSVQTVSWRSSMGAGQLQPQGREPKNMTL